MAKVAEKIRTLSSAKDLYTLSLFLLWKLSDIPEYAVTSQLAYILDKESLLNVCDFFGGETIKIPTRDELTNMFYVMDMYQMVNIDNVPVNDAIKKIHETNNAEVTERIVESYNKLVEIMDNYEIN